VLLTIDLTSAVAQEAIDSPTSVIISYHPPIFKPLSSLTLSNSIQKSLLLCAAHGISVYSPHTALDSVNGGINDWLAGVVVDGQKTGFEKVYAGAEKEPGVGGEGRLVRLEQEIEMDILVQRIKRHLKLDKVEVAYSTSRDLKKIKSVSMCAGAGGSMLLGTDADVYFTGEMSHHEVLAAVASGHNVVLCGHTNTERGYLPTLAKNLAEELKSGSGYIGEAKGLDVHVSQQDRHPLIAI